MADNTFREDQIRQILDDLGIGIVGDLGGYGMPPVIIIGGVNAGHEIMEAGFLSRKLKVGILSNQYI